MFIEIKGIRKHFGEGESLVEVLKGIDVSLEKGEFCVLLIETVNKKYGNTVIMVTHNDAIKHMADRVIKLYQGM